MINIINSPEFVHRVNTLLPIRVSDIDVNTLNNYKYIIGIAYNAVSTSSAVQNNINSVIYTQLNFPFITKQNKGEKVLIRFTTFTQYDGLYTILDKVGNSITIDFPFNLSIPPTEVYNMYSYTHYKFIPDLDGEAKTQLQSVMTNFVDTTIPDISLLYEDASETEFQYWLTTIREYDYSLLFIDNTFLLSNLGFITNDLPLYEIGDTVNIVQDNYTWSFDSVSDDGGNLQISNTTTQTNYQVGQIINVFSNGINGFYEILTIDVTLQLVTLNFPYSASIGPSGDTYGTPSPQYDGVGTIIDILVDSPVVGQYTVVLNKPFNQSTNAIGGSITSYPNKKIVNEIQTFDSKSAYRGTNKTNDYDPVRFVDYYFNEDDDKSPNSIMTPWDLYNDNRVFTIDTKLVYKLLIHTAYSIPNYLQMVLLDNNGNQVYNGIQQINLSSRNFYFEANPAEWIGQGTPILTQTNIDAASSVNYQLFDGDNDTEMTRQFQFNLVDKCSRTEYKHSLIFEDHLGSYISLPFFMKKTMKINKKNNSIYKKVGRFDLTNDTFNHNNMDGGQDSYSTDYVLSYVLNTDYLDENENEMFQDLFISNNIFMEDLLDTASEPRRVIINKDELKVINQYDGLIQYNISITESIKQTIK